MLKVAGKWIVYIVPSINQRIGRLTSRHSRVFSVHYHVVANRRCMFVWCLWESHFKKKKKKCMSSCTCSCSFNFSFLLSICQLWCLLCILYLFRFHPGAVCLLLISSAVTMVVPFGIGRVIDIIYTPDDTGSMIPRLKRFCQILLVVFVIGAVANFGRVYLMQVSGACFQVVL